MLRKWSIGYAAVPGSIKTESVYDIEELRDFIREIPKWCDDIRNDLVVLTVRSDPLDELRSKLQASIDEIVIDGDNSFSEEELYVVDARFDKLYEDIESLRDQYVLTKNQLDELRAEIEEFKRSARSYPKGIWAKITGNKLVRTIGNFVNTPEGRTFLFQQLRRALGMNVHP